MISVIVQCSESSNFISRWWPGGGFVLCDCFLWYITYQHVHSCIAATVYVSGPVFFLESYLRAQVQFI